MTCKAIIKEKLTWFLVGQVLIRQALAKCKFIPTLKNKLSKVK
jgi:hypothetical protein